MRAGRSRLGRGGGCRGSPIGDGFGNGRRLGRGRPGRRGRDRAVRGSGGGLADGRHRLTRSLCSLRRRRGSSQRRSSRLRAGRLRWACGGHWAARAGALLGCCRRGGCLDCRDPNLSDSGPGAVGPTDDATLDPGDGEPASGFGRNSAGLRRRRRRCLGNRGRNGRGGGRRRARVRTRLSLPLPGGRSGCRTQVTRRIRCGHEGPRRSRRRRRRNGRRGRCGRGHERRRGGARWASRSGRFACRVDGTDRGRGVWGTGRGASCRTAGPARRARLERRRHQPRSDLRAVVAVARRRA